MLGICITTKTKLHMLKYQAFQQNIKKEIQESREFFRTLVEFTNGIHWEMDLVTKKFTYVSPQIEKILGFKPEKWDTFEAWSSTIHPDDYEYAVDYCNNETKLWSK